MTTPAFPLFLVRDGTDRKKTLGREIIGPKTTMDEIQDFIEPRVPSIPEVKIAEEWKELDGDLPRRVVEAAIDHATAASADGQPEGADREGVGIDKMPELFCFGLLPDFDMKELIALAAPRPDAIAK